MTEREAEDFWNLAHLIRLHLERGQATEVNKGANGHGDGKQAADWVAGIRKLIKDDNETYILDYVYGDFGFPITYKQTVRAAPILRKFTLRLKLRPELQTDYPRMYSNFIGD